MREDIDARIQGTKDNLINSLMYYRMALKQQGCQDINQEIATIVGQAMGLTNEQQEYVFKSANVNPKKIIENIKILIKSAENNKGQLSEEAISVIIKTLTLLENKIKIKE